jgi:uncharacterized protein
MRHVDIAPGLRICNERCAILQRSEAMVIGDLHLGVEASLEMEGLQLPRAQVETMKRMVSSAAETYRPKRIVVLGDLKHEFSRNLDQEWREVRGMIEHLQSLADVTVVRGNHDNYLANITSRLGVDLVEELEVDGFHLSHGHLINEGRPLVQGHEHPSVRLFDGVGGYLKLPAFLHLPEQGVLIMPAFSPLAAGNDVNNLTSENMLSPGLKGIDLSRAMAYGCSDIGLLRTALNAEPRKERAARR